MTDWRTYLAGFHARHAGITEDVLGRTLSDGLSPYDWLARAIPSDVGRVLDLACGSGPMTRVLSDAVPGRRTQVTGLDLSMAELARARECTRPDDDTSLVCGEAAGLPFADGCFDAVTSSMAMMVFDRYQPVLAECRRVLRPGGVLAMTVATAVPLRPSDVRFLTRLTARLRAVPQFPGGAELAGLANALDAIGFRM